MTPSGAAPPHPHILAQGKHIKNRLDGPKTTPPRTKHAKFQASIMFRLGCRGGWVKKWGVTFSIQKILVNIPRLSLSPKHCQCPLDRILTTSCGSRGRIRRDYQSLVIFTWISGSFKNMEQYLPAAQFEFSPHDTKWLFNAVYSISARYPMYVS